MGEAGEGEKIGYFALLRNLRNILEQAPEVLEDAIATLINPEIVKNSMVLPFRFTTAFDEIKKMSASKGVRSVLVALNKAVDIATSNVPKFEGETLVVLDTSSSMSHGSRLKNSTPAQIGSLFAAVLVKSNDADLISFDSNARYHNINTVDSTITIANSLRFDGGSTNFHSIFDKANKKYDRVIILSDMQGWAGGHHTPVAEFNAWKNKYGANPYIYSFDLNSYGSMQFPEQNVFCIAGFSEKIFDIMRMMETDRKALINTIKAVEL